MSTVADPDNVRLRTALRDLVALSAVPAAWVGREPSAIAAGLADVLVGSLYLDFVLVRLCDAKDGAAVEATRGDASKSFRETLQRYAVEGGLSQRQVIPDVCVGAQRCRGVVIPIGVDAASGLVAAASPRAQFPDEIDQLLLSVAANQGATACQHASLLHERRRTEERLRQARDELETKVAERTAELLRTTAELREREAKIRRLVESNVIGVHFWDLDGGLTEANDAFLRTVGYSRQDLLSGNVNWASITPPEYRAADAHAIEELAQSGTFQPYEKEYVRKDGERVSVLLAGATFEGSSEQGVAFILDLTERKLAEAERFKLEERLRQAEKMEAIGRFASGIAHDFNNVLGGILAYGEMLFDEAPENTTRKRYAQNVLTAATRGRDLVDQILAYTRSQRGEHVPTNICRTVAETLELVRSSLPAKITLHATIPDEPLVVMGNATQLHQVVMNLCTNSVHAMKAGGPLRVAITALDVFEDCALSHGTLRPAGYARVSVEDGGCGMDEATLSRIFEPFFTTKEVGRGTGLGLALVYAIVADFGGAIDVKSTPDEGSTFAIYIPLADVRDVAIVA
jgi:PAS domain S-box-containing protein